MDEGFIACTGSGCESGLFFTRWAPPGIALFAAATGIAATLADL
jgi:hypothetical protein